MSNINKSNVLVFPCGSEIGLEIYRSLSLSTHFDLIGGSSVDDHGSLIYENYIGGLPLIDDEDFITKLNIIINNNKIDYIFPAHDSVVFKLAKESKMINCKIISSPVNTCIISRSKRLTYEVLRDVIPTPIIYSDIGKIKNEDFPVFLKPDIGQGSKGTCIANNREDIEFYLCKDQTLIVTELLPGDEFTIDCFTDKNGKLTVCLPRMRTRIQNGISARSEIVEDNKFNEIAESINSTIKFRGVWFFQLKRRSSGELVLLEIAPRVAGTMGLTRSRGVNLPLLSLFDVQEYDTEVMVNNYEILIDRALENKYKHNIKYNHVYIDLDDLIVFEDKVNPYVIAFLFQCTNKGVKAHLITRHRGDLTATLDRYKLTGIFNEVIWLKNKEDKHKFITEKSAIFIDDSFAERKSVHDKLGIPVFDAHMIESLLD